MVDHASMPADQPDTRDYPRWQSLLSGAARCTGGPDALDANVATLLDALEGTDVTIRIATKSVRCTAVLRYIIEQGGRAFAV